MLTKLIRPSALVAAACVALCGLAIAAPASARVAADGASFIDAATDRLAGPDRFATSVEVSRSSYPGTASVVYLASGLDFPDALAAGPSAALQKGPVLLSRQDSVPAGVRAEIERLRPDRVVIVGGTVSISSRAEKSLSGSSWKVERIGGADRYATARKMVTSTFSGTVSKVYVASGRDFPDSLSAGAAAAKHSGPILLIDGQAATVDAETVALLKQLKPGSIVVAGGLDAVNQPVYAALARLAPSIERVAGYSRMETSALIAGAWSSASHVYLASATQAADAVVASAAAGARGEPLLVTIPWCVDLAIVDRLKELSTTSVTFVGGPDALPQELLERGCIFRP
ncbi:cell wall-binding repeat-containing protein [Leifsonia poae]|uniref:cell wall-binding repeat-containing protein n=1 Tax=Leifsonia poae TaxID=110933 RepID=UPI003D68C75C